jgi:hypothetical protein
MGSDKGHPSGHDPQGDQLVGGQLPKILGLQPLLSAHRGHDGFSFGLVDPIVIAVSGGGRPGSD